MVERFAENQGSASGHVSSQEVVRSKSTSSPVNMGDAERECKSSTGDADLLPFYDQRVQNDAKI
jgi:hypothetical protein